MLEGPIVAMGSLAAYWLVDEITEDEIFSPDMDKQR